MDKIDFTTVQNVAFRIAYKKLGAKEDAEDIAQIVLMKLYLNIEKVKPEAIKTWVTKVTNNEIADFCKNNKISLTGQDFDVIPDEQLPESHVIEEKKHDPILDEIINTLPPEQKRLINIYFSTGDKIRAIAEREDIGYDKLKKLLYRVKKDIFAEYHIRTGYRTSKDIVGAKLNENIQRFMKKFKKCVETDSLEKMRIYFGKKISTDEIPKLNIKKIHDYQIRLLAKNHYRLTMVFFEHNKETPSFLFTNVEITESGNIRVTDLPSVPGSVTACKPENMPDNLADLILKREKGRPVLSDEQFRDIADTYGVPVAPTAASEIKKESDNEDNKK